MAGLFVVSVLMGQGLLAQASSQYQDQSPQALRSRPASAEAAGERGFLDYQRKMSELLRQEATAKTDAVRAAAVCGLCDLHGQIVADSRYATSATLKEYRARLWSRLSKVKADLKREFGRDAGHELALADAASLESADSLSVLAADSLTSSLALAGQAQGGPAALLESRAWGGGAGTADWGPQLVTLIERTINPAFWDVVGGPGTIVYYQPLQCLVVRATAEVHGNVGGLLGGLRKAGP